MSQDVKKTPTEWMRTEPFKGYEILDADGWRGKDAPAWDEPITEREFLIRYGMSTTRVTPEAKERVMNALAD